MSRRRSFCWNTALSDLRADRASDEQRRAAIEAFNAKKLDEARARDAARAAREQAAREAAAGEALRAGLDALLAEAA